MKSNINVNSSNNFLDLRYQQLTDVTLENSFNSFKDLDQYTKVDLRDNNLTTAGIINLLNMISKRNLEEIYLGYNSFGKCDTSELFAKLSDFKGLKKLYINDSFIFDEGIKHLTNNFKYHPNLTHLDLSSNQIKFEGAKYLGDFLAHNSSLSTIYLSYNQIGEVGAKFLFMGISKNSSLKKIYIRSNAIKDDGLKIISSLLQNNNILESINIGDNEISDKGIEEFCKFLKVSKSIKSLNLGRNNISNIGASAIANIFLQQRSQIEHLNIGKNQIGDVGASALAQSLCNNNILKIFNVRDNNISEEGAKEIGSMLEHNNTIDIVNICDNHLGNEGVRVLCESIENNNHLKCLYITNNNYDEKGTEFLNLLKRKKEDLLLVHFFDKNKYYSSTSNFTKVEFLNGQLSSSDLKKLLKELKDIAVINIQNVRLDSDLMFVISDYLNTQIVALNLSNNSIDAESAKILAKGIEKCSNLEILELKNNNLGREGAKYIAQALEDKKPIFVDMSYNYVGFEFIEEICEYHKLDRLAWTF